MTSNGYAEGPSGAHNAYFSMLNAPEDIAVDVDDYIFLRPTQSESVMLQFGDLIVVRGGEVVDRWPVFSQGA